jgi:homopolymeric O-antigen transport system ATP-binding protein
VSQPAIRVHRLSKAYLLGHRHKRGRTFREMLVDVAAAPLRRLRGEPDGATTETFWALKDVSFDVQPGEIVGIIGRNGAGKSTLLKILSRITEPTSGHAELHGRVASLLEVGTGFHPDLTGRENIFLNGALLGMTQAEVRRKFDAIVDFSEVEKFLDTAVKHYSSGMYVRLAFAVAAHLDTEVLLVDEVLAVGDAAFQRKCLGKVRELTSQQRTVFFVSHNMAAVSYLCRRGIVLEHSRVAFDGEVGEAVAFYNSRFVEQSHDGKRASHVLFDAPENAARFDFAITRIEMLETRGAPKPMVSTGDDVVFRFHYSSKRELKRGSVLFELASLEGAKLWMLSTQPDGTLPLEFVPGAQAVDCTVRNLPLAAGEYVVGAGLAVPQTEFLWREQELARMTVLPADVYGSGMAPTATRCLLAVDHEWRALSTTAQASLQGTMESS